MNLEVVVVGALVGASQYGGRGEEQDQAAPAVHRMAKGRQGGSASVVRLYAWSKWRLLEVF